MVAHLRRAAYLPPSHAVVAEPKGLARQGREGGEMTGPLTTKWIRPETRVGLLHIQDTAKENPSDPRRIPIVRARIVGHSHEGSAHSQRTHPDRLEHLRLERSARQEGEQQRDTPAGPPVAQVVATGRPMTTVGDHPTSTAAAITVVHSPFLSPTEV